MHFLSVLNIHASIFRHRGQPVKWLVSSITQCTAAGVAAHLFSFELLEALLPVEGKLGLLAPAGLCQGSLDLHLPPPAPGIITTLDFLYVYFLYVYFMYVYFLEVDFLHVQPT